MTRSGMGAKWTRASSYLAIYINVGYFIAHEVV